MRFIQLVIALAVLVNLWGISERIASVQAIASQLASQIETPYYALQTAEGFNMDCLKAIKTSDTTTIGVFHSSIEQKGSGYNALYLAEMKTSFYSNQWSKLAKLSQRGSQGYLYEIKGSGSYLVLYQLQNHEHGNTIAVRYYQSFEKLAIDNFLYEYQLSQKIDRVNVRNIGTPSVEDLVLTYQETNPHLNNFNLTIKFHYSPDGVRDLPGFGYVSLVPLRDFVDSQGQWVGGCKQRYNDWVATSTPPANLYRTPHRFLI